MTMALFRFKAQETDFLVTLNTELNEMTTAEQVGTFFSE